VTCRPPALRPLAAALLALLLAALPAAAEEDACAAPAGLTQLDQPLPRIASRLRSGGPVTIVALGSSSTTGVGASSPARSYPSRLAAHLAERFPHTMLIVHNKGVSGDMAPGMIDRFKADVFDLAPDLVIWQVGTNSLVRNVSLAEHLERIRDGLDQLQAAGLDVIVMDPQYSPRVTERPAHQGVIDGIAEMARERGIPVLHRFAIMRYWATVRGLSLETILDTDTFHMNDFSYDCIAGILAAALERAALPPPTAGLAPR